MRVLQSTGHLMYLLKAIQSGSLAPAAFQRPYVWDQANVLAFCESIVERFPVGGVLTWSPESKVDLSAVGRTRLGPVEVTSSRYTGLLLDGQNRLATLAWFLHTEGDVLPADLSDAEALTWGGAECLVANPMERKFEFVHTSVRDAGMRLPARVVIDGTYANQQTRARFDREWSVISASAKDDALEWLDRTADAFREAVVPHTHLENASVEDAKRAFLHICKVGVPMSDEDFDKATAWAMPAAINRDIK